LLPESARNNCCLVVVLRRSWGRHRANCSPMIWLPSYRGRWIRFDSTAAKGRGNSILLNKVWFDSWTWKDSRLYRHHIMRKPDSTVFHPFERRNTSLELSESPDTIPAPHNLKPESTLFHPCFLKSSPSDLPAEPVNPYKPNSSSQASAVIPVITMRIDNFLFSNCPSPQSSFSASRSTPAIKRTSNACKIDTLLFSIIAFRILGVDRTIKESVSTSKNCKQIKKSQLNHHTYMSTRAVSGIMRLLYFIFSYNFRAAFDPLEEFSLRKNEIMVE
jgi:hypothetical protein